MLCPSNRLTFPYIYLNLKHLYHKDKAILSAATWLKRFSFNLLEFFLPRLCLFCGGIVAEEAAAAVCPDCEAKIAWAESPLCPRCGLVFASREGEDHLCGPCQTEAPPFRRALAAAVYDGPAAEAVTKFKYSRRQDYLPVMHTWLQQPHCLELAAAADLIVPVPLHKKRLKFRGFNQALLLAQAFKDRKPVPRETLVRVRHTVPQTGLSPQERRDNVRRAFAVPRPEEVKDKNVLLVDDVYTTGATVKECARALLKAGARQVDVLTVARVRYD